MLDIMLSRRSVRKFRDEKVSDEDRKKLISAGLAAPSSMAKFPVELIITEDRKTIEELKTCKTFGTTALNTAPMVITVIADSELSDVWIEDASIAATYIMLEAEKLGMGLCWIQMRRRNGTAESSEIEVRKVLGIPEKYGVVALLAVGYKAEFPEGYTEDKLNSAKVHSERF